MANGCVHRKVVYSNVEQLPVNYPVGSFVVVGWLVGLVCFGFFVCGFFFFSQKAIDLSTE